MQPDLARPTSAQQGIDAANRKFEAAFNAGDPARAAREVYTRDATILPPGAPKMQGMEAIEQFWPAAAQQLGIQGIQLETVDLDVQGETAVEIGRATLSFAGGQSGVAKFVVVWKLQDGQWRWHVDIWNMDS